MNAKINIVPVLVIASGISDIDFYKKAFGATELWRISNPDGSVHVATFSIGDVSFRLHEASKNGKNASPVDAHFTTVSIGLTVDDVQGVISNAIAAGATEVSPATDYEYGFRQGEIKDIFGHHWIIEKLIDEQAWNTFLKMNNENSG